MRKILYSAQAERTLRRIDRQTSARIRGKIAQYAEDPESLSANVKTLRGRSGKRLRIGDWRVIFTETLIVLTVERIGSRGNIY